MLFRSNILCGGYSGGKQFVTAEQLREKLSHLRYEKALIVKLKFCFCFCLERLEINFDDWL